MYQLSRCLFDFFKLLGSNMFDILCLDQSEEILMNFTFRSFMFYCEVHVPDKRSLTQSSSKPGNFLCFFVNVSCVPYGFTNKPMPLGIFATFMYWDMRYMMMCRSNWLLLYLIIRGGIDRTLRNK